MLGCFRDIQREKSRRILCQEKSVVQVLAIFFRLSKEEEEKIGQFILIKPGTKAKELIML